MSVSSFITMDYEQRTMNYEIKNKANSNPIQTQFKPNTKPKRTQFKAKQTQFQSQYMLSRLTINTRRNLFRPTTNTDLFPNPRKSRNRLLVASVLSYQNVSRRKAAFYIVFQATPGTLLSKTNFSCNRNFCPATISSKVMVHQVISNERRLLC
jgi:hypothetical protein